MEESESVWISVQESQPEDCALCLVWDINSRRQCIARFRLVDKGVGWNVIGDETMEQSQITHWRPLPGFQE